MGGEHGLPTGAELGSNALQSPASRNNRRLDGRRHRTEQGFRRYMSALSGNLSTCLGQTDPCAAYYPTFVADGSCDNAEYGGFDYCTAYGTCADYFDCRVRDGSCSTCVAAGGFWCAGAALCLLTVDEVVPYAGDAEMCSSSSDRLSTCPTEGASAPFFTDAQYDAQAWVYGLINVRPVWEAGWTGAGVQVVFNDDGLSTSHPGTSDQLNSRDRQIGSRHLTAALLTASL